MLEGILLNIPNVYAGVAVISVGILIWEKCKEVFYYLMDATGLTIDPSEQEYDPSMYEMEEPPKKDFEVYV